MEKKENNKIIKIAFFILGLVVLISLGYYFVYYFILDNNNSISEVKIYNFNDTYGFGTLENVNNPGLIYYNYRCKNVNCTGMAVTSQYAVITDGDYQYVYDYVSKEVISDQITIDSAEFASNFGIILKSKDNLYGYFNIDEKELVIPIEYEFLGVPNSEETFNHSKYDLSNALSSKIIMATKNGQSGVINVQTGAMIIALSNDKIRFTFDGNIIIKKENKEKLYTPNGNLLLSGKEYDNIYISFTNGKVLVNDNNKLFLIKKDGTILQEVSNVFKDYQFIDYSIGECNDEISFRSSNNKELKYYYDYEKEKIITEQPTCVPGN